MDHERIKVTGLTMYWLEDEYTLWESSGLKEIDVKFTKTTVTGTREFLDGCLGAPIEAHTYRTQTEALEVS